MLSIPGRKREMVGDSKPLQGNLFGGVEEHSTNPKAIENVSKVEDCELSEKDLTADAENRPRKRQTKKQANKQESASSSKHTQTGSYDKDRPAWSNHSMVDLEKLTPVLRHYVELKRRNPSRILLYRLGDFFECFFEDAITLSNLLELTLTGKEGGKYVGRVPMAGIPHHAVDRYCADLIRHGLSVALCDQLEASPSKGTLLKRDITRVITPGTVIEEGLLTARKNNWLAAVVIDTENSNNRFCWGLACADISTGDFIVTQREGESALHQELTRFEAAELLLGRSTSTERPEWCPNHLHLTMIANTPFSLPEAEHALLDQYQIKVLDGLGLKEEPLALRAAGGILAYLKETKPLNCDNNLETHLPPIALERPQCTYAKDFLVLDAQTRRNLEITTTQRDGQFHGSLLWALDRTLTSMGGRCLRRWLEAPLMDANSILARQNVVSTLVKEKELRNLLQRLLRSMSDLERLAGRAGAGQSGAREMVAIADGIERLPYFAEQLQGIWHTAPKWMEDLINFDQKLLVLAENIRHYIVEDPPLSLSDGGIIHDGVDPILDGLRNQLDDQDNWLASQETLERELSGNNNLRLQYHRTFGYFLTVSKAKAGSVPEHWIRRQTLANEERFITPDLKAREGRIFQLKARTAQREYEIFCNQRDMVGAQAKSIRKAARAIAGLDALTSLADIAATNAYCCPEILKPNKHKSSKSLYLKQCRHPVVEQLLVEENFKPNDLLLGEETDLIVLTGPNASGKSCYLRQIGLSQLLTQIGSWVPAKKARLGICDRIFTRVGAVDDLAAGQSTFMVEMAETASILNQATNLSLVLLDEIGRGTATYDGLSIAWAVSEFLAQNIQSKTIFATHYHELNSLSKNLTSVANFQVLVKETGHDLLFLHQVAPGGASRSYGIEAARLAGVPDEVIHRAKEILSHLEIHQPRSNKSLASSEKLQQSSIKNNS